MNTETGEIRQFTKKQLQNLLNPEKWTEIDSDQMTNKQKKNMQVSKFDNKSELGKLYTSHRKLSRREKNRFKKKHLTTNNYI